MSLIQIVSRCNMMIIHRVIVRRSNYLNNNFHRKAEYGFKGCFEKSFVVIDNYLSLKVRLYSESGNRTAEA